MANRYPESSVYHDVYQEGYVDATADTILVMKSNGKAVRDYLRGVQGRREVQNTSTRRCSSP